MTLRYPALLALTLALSGVHPGGVHTSHGKGRVAQRPVAAVRDIYSARALRQARIILQMKLLELRSERLERVRRAIEQRLPVDEILKM